MGLTEKEGKGDKAKGFDCEFGSKGLQGMFEKMAKCCEGKEGSPDCSAMMEKMKEVCCGSKTDKTETEKAKP